MSEKQKQLLDSIGDSLAKVPAEKLNFIAGYIAGVADAKEDKDVQGEAEKADGR